MALVSRNVSLETLLLKPLSPLYIFYRLQYTIYAAGIDDTGDHTIGIQQLRRGNRRRGLQSV